MVYCRNCGAAMEDSAQFCSKCGTPNGLLKESNDRANPNIINNDSIDDNNEEVKPKSSKTKKALAFIIPLIILAVSIGLVIVFTRGMDNRSSFGNAEVSTDELPDWYMLDAVTVKGNELCFCRSDGIYTENEGKDFTVVYHYVFNTDGTLRSMKDYTIYDDERQAKFYAEAASKMREDGSGRDNYGYFKGDVNYYYKDNIMITEYLPQYTRANVGSLDDEIARFKGYGWEVHYIE